MSRHSPSGFAFSMLIEIAAVVIIVSLLPRVDLRPRVNAAPLPGSGDSQAIASGTPSLLTSLQQSPAEVAPSRAPGLVDAPPLNPQDVERRLDRASQQLVNSFGSTVSNVATDLAEAIRPTLTPQSASPGLSQFNFSQPGPIPAERQVTLLPPLPAPSTLAPPTSGASTSPPSFNAAATRSPPIAFPPSATQPSYSQPTLSQHYRPQTEPNMPAAPAGSFPTQPRPWLRY